MAASGVCNFSGGNVTDYTFKKRRRPRLLVTCARCILNGGKGVRDTDSMTSPDLRRWPASDRKFRRSEVTAVVGNGDAVWKRAANEVLRWRVKTASGFAVDSSGPVLRRQLLQQTALVVQAGKDAAPPPAPVSPGCCLSG